MKLRNIIKRVALIPGLFLGCLIVLGLVLYLITWGEYSVPLTAADDRSIPTISVNDTVFHVQTFGSKKNKPVIIIHGGPGNDFKYLLPLKPLSDNYFLIFYDQRGTGLSPRVPAEEHSLENNLADLTAIADYYSPDKKVSLIGHSWGAMLASGYMARHPNRVHKAVLAEPGMLNAAQAKRYMSEFKVSFSWTLARQLLLILFESLHLKNKDLQAKGDYIFGRLSGIDSPDNPMSRYFCGRSLKSAYIPVNRLSMVGSQAVMKKGMDSEGNIQLDLVTGAERFNRKVLFITGECNTLIGRQFQLDHMKFFPKAEMKVIPNAGHTMFGEKPVISMQIIREYLED